MRSPLLFLCVALGAFAFSSCTSHQPPSDAAAANPATLTIPTGYDSLSAQKFGADEYGMRKYVMAFLKAGPNRDLDSTTAADLQTAHLQNIERMAAEGKLCLAGPFFGRGDMRGIYIFNVQSLAEAEALTYSDPAVQAGSLVMELREWYGSAALLAVNDIHNTLAEKSPSE